MSRNNNLVFQHLYPVDDVPIMGDRSRNNNNQNPLWNMRERLFNVLFERITVTYAFAIPAAFRKCVEFAFLALAVLSLLILAYIHMTFIQTQVNCLEQISKDWPRDGILRVEIRLSDSYRDFRDYYESCDQHGPSEDRLIDSEDGFAGKLKYFQPKSAFSNNDFKFRSNYSAICNKTYSNHVAPMQYCSSPLSYPATDVEVFSKTVWPQEEYIVEYSLEYGLLKLSPLARQKINIPILTVILDPKEQQCFGNTFSQLLLKYVVGYSDVLMSSLKNLVDHDENKGFVRNVITGDQYRFVDKNMSSMSYVAAAFIMMVFTLSISMLLRYSHHQIFLFIVELLHVLELNLNASFPAAPLLTVVLALVGMEAIMSEFFNDTTTAFYIILIVWIADQYDTICCRTVITKRHWLRFFYLYHFAFYAYDYRFNGQYSGLALFTSWLFIQHSMIYFFHHYELPPLSHTSEPSPHGNNDSSPPTDNFSWIVPAEAHRSSVADIPGRNMSSNEPPVQSENSTTIVEGMAQTRSNSIESPVNQRIEGSVTSDVVTTGHQIQSNSFNSTSSNSKTKCGSSIQVACLSKQST